MLNTDDETIVLRDIDGHILAHVAKFMEYKLKYQNAPTTIEVPPFDIPPKDAVDLMMAAHFLEI